MVHKLNLTYSLYFLWGSLWQIEYKPIYAHRIYNVCLVDKTVGGDEDNRGEYDKIIRNFEAINNNYENKALFVSVSSGFPNLNCSINWSTNHTVVLWVIAYTSYLPNHKNRPQSFYVG